MVDAARLEPERPAWHAMEAPEVLDRLGASRAGLDAAAAAVRLAEHGPNRLPEPPRRGALPRFLDQFRNLLIYVLLAAALISALLGHAIDAAVILAVVVVNAIVGFVQEGKAEEALAAIRGMLAPHAAVLRDGRRADVDASDIVPGDIVLVEAGDRVPADLRIISGRGLRVEEALLTGESVPVGKELGAVVADAPLGDRQGMLFSGTLVVAGQGRGVAVATGAATEIGRISAMLARVETLETPLLRQMNSFARQITVVILALSAGAFAIALLRGWPGRDAFMAVVGLAVAAIPEGLPAVLTVTLAIGVRGMAARNAVIRRLPAVETLGAVGVICSDKTGTFTHNEMVAGAVVTAAGTLLIEGKGYGPEAAIAGPEGGDPDPEALALLNRIARVGALCNDAALRQERDGEWRVAGDPMEGALLALAARAGVEADADRLEAIPFDPRHRWMATLHEARDGGGRHLAVKGAPEALIALCAEEAAAEGSCPIDVASWEAAAQDLADRGFRVLALAERTLPADAALGEDRLPSLTLLGLVGLLDPPREEAIAAVAECRAAGIRVKMITGDHPGTARAIAVQLGLAETRRVLTGPALDCLDDEALRAAVAEVDVFARTSPEQKLRLVTALQANGAVVAMTGDGVNDAPALKRADVGVAMGLKGTEAAKEAAEMVLADDNFASIAAAVREGRTVYDNLQKVIAWTLPTNGGESLVVLLAILLGFALPMSPVQILWINMVTAVALGLTLAFEPAERDVMARPPRRPGAPLLSAALVWRVVMVSCVIAAATFAIDLWAVGRGLSTEQSRTLVVNAIVAMEAGYLFAARQSRGSGFSAEGLRGTPAIWIGVAIVTALQAAFTWLPPFQSAFGTAAIGATEVLACLGAGALLMVLVEAEKAMWRSFGRRRGRSRSGG
ncbi:HAD-IC family P-type ATPase [Roseomonas sp. HF4]|uniref:HAD-IC family P-type ATPase n=1 Tax=Roseomonas sp. HF4 TaxID=2562313 RepID=UPI0010C0B2D3|nr:HAD-IC family P-type ATPase [Roseomonas sp. HF4]